MAPLDKRMKLSEGSYPMSLATSRWLHGVALCSGCAVLARP